MSANKMSQDAKKEEFKKYLEKAGVLEVLTKSLVSLYEEPDKPGDAVTYLKKSVGGTENDKAEIEKLQAENAELKSKVSVEQCEVEKNILILCFMTDRCHGGETVGSGGQTGETGEVLAWRVRSGGHHGGELGSPSSRSC